MIEKLKTHIGLGRFFGTPVVLGAVLLGIALGGHWSWLSLMIVLASIFEMAYAHSFNTLLDYSWTGLDKGTEEERSKGKVYTKGQQAIAAGQLSPRGVLINGLVYLAISAIFTAVVAWYTSYVIWIIWAVAALCTFWYSWGKLHYQCELALGVGFGPVAVMLGMATQANPDFLLAFLAGIPILFVWGYGAETLDQWTDAEPNWPRGLRNFGALLWKNNISVTAFISWMVVMTFISQIIMIVSGILHPLTAITLITFIPFSFMLLYLEKDLKVGIYWGLVGGIFLYCILLPIGQILGGVFF